MLFTAYTERWKDTEIEKWRGIKLRCLRLLYDAGVEIGMTTYQREGLAKWIKWTEEDPHPRCEGRTEFEIIDTWRDGEGDEHSSRTEIKIEFGIYKLDEDEDKTPKFRAFVKLRESGHSGMSISGALRRAALFRRVGEVAAELELELTAFPTPNTNPYDEAKVEAYNRHSKTYWEFNYGLKDAKAKALVAACLAPALAGEWDGTERSDFTFDAKERRTLKACKKWLKVKHRRGDTSLVSLTPLARRYVAYELEKKAKEAEAA